MRFISYDLWLKPFYLLIITLETWLVSAPMELLFQKFWRIKELCSFLLNLGNTNFQKKLSIFFKIYLKTSKKLAFSAPKLYEHLINIDSNVDTVAAAATNWLLVIFIDPAVDINVTLRIWDAFLCEGNKVLVRWCLALYIHQEERLMKCRDQAQVMQILKHKIIDIKVH